MTDLDVVVVNYHTNDDLIRFVNSYLDRESEIESKLWIFDVDSDASLNAYIREWRCEKEFSYSLKNIGYAAACNRMYAMSDAPVVAFFNADTVLGKTTLDDCYNALTENNDWGVVGPLQVNRQDKVTHAGIFGTNQKPVHRNWQQPVSDEVRDIREAITVSGSAYFLKRELGDKILNDSIYQQRFPDAKGPFLPESFLFYEETLISYLARYYGYKVMYLGTTQMIHEWHGSIKKNPIKASVMEESQKLFRETLDLYGVLHD